MKFLKNSTESQREQLCRLATMYLECFVNKSNYEMTIIIPFLTNMNSLEVEVDCSATRITISSILSFSNFLEPNYIFLWVACFESNYYQFLGILFKCFFFIFVTIQVGRLNFLRTKIILFLYLTFLWWFHIFFMIKMVDYIISLLQSLVTVQPSSFLFCYQNWTKIVNK